MRHFSAPVTGAQAKRDLAQSRPGELERNQKRNGGSFVNNTSKIIDVTGRSASFSNPFGYFCGSGACGGFMWGGRDGCDLSCSCSCRSRGVSRTHTFCSACGVVCVHQLATLAAFVWDFLSFHLSLQSAQRKVTTRTAGAPRYFLMDSRGIGAGDNSRPAGIYLC